MHGFIQATLSGILGAMAGKPTTKYITDADGRVVPAPNQPVDTNADRGRRLAAHALEGLAAGAQVPQQKSGAASALAGLGAGASAATASANAADAKARQQARENEDAKQRTILQKHNVALGNAAMMSHYWEMRKQGIELLQPSYDSHKALGSALTEAGVQVPEMFAEEADKLRQADPHFLADHVILPVGQAPVTDDKGNQLFGPNENGDQVIPLMHERVMVIPAAHKDDTTGTTKFQIPSALADEIHQFAPIAGGSGYDGLKAGDEYSLDQLSPILTQMQLGRKSVAAGWQEKTPGENAALDKDGNIIQRNPASGETRPYKGGAPLQAKERLANIGNKEDKGGVTDALKFVQDREDARAKMKLKQEQAAGNNTDVFGNTSTLNEKEFNKRYDAFNKSKQYQTVQTLQGSYQQFQDIVNDINSGKDMTGAQSVVGLFNAIGISAVPLAGKGFRINENTIKEHVDARGLDQAAYQRLLKLKNGDVITPEQMKDYASIATGVYRDTYINAANEERRQLGYIDVLPLGNNEVVDQVTGSLYLKVAGGDRAKAEAALKKSGWQIPQ